MSSGETPWLSVVIPTLDEAERLPALLADLEPLGAGVEAIVADGGSTDGTVALAAGAGARVVHAPRGRSRQLRAGAEAAAAEWLLFLHADSRLGPGGAEAARAFVRSGEGTRFAHFRFALDGPGWFWRFIEWGQRLRERALGLVYGDQGLLVHRSAYAEAGGYPPWPIMEDVGLVARLRDAGAERVQLEAPLTTSPRRYQAEGRWRAFLRNAALIGAFRLGVAPERLARWYRPRGAAAPPAVLLVFAKAPRPGAVKTRLAADVGADRAARIYRAMGRGVLDGVRGGAYEAVVCYTPAGAGEEVRAWLGEGGMAFRPQADGDLGARMAEAFAYALGRASRACVIGTDAPDVDGRRVEEALAALDAADVVLGPAVDGGYYLMALRAPARGLFEGIPWSTDRVLERTVERAGELGLTVHLLERLADVDRAADLPPALRAV